MNVADWLRQIGLEQYVQLFAEHDISAEVLPHLTADDLKDSVSRWSAIAGGCWSPSEALRGPRPGEAAPRAGAGSSSERRQITVLFCDIVGSTPLSTQLDPEEFRDLLSAFQLNVTAAVTATGGYVARVIGDGLLVYFGWPHADEAHAESAVRAGLAIIDTTRTHHCRYGSALRAALS